MGENAITIYSANGLTVSLLIEPDYPRVEITADDNEDPRYYAGWRERGIVISLNQFIAIGDAIARYGNYPDHTAP